MEETILNIYLIINDGLVTGFKAKAYKSGEGDNEKILFLKQRARDDFSSAFRFDPPINAKGELMSYNKFSKLEKRGYHFKLFEEIFQKFNVPENPLICVTPIAGGEFLGE